MASNSRGEFRIQRYAQEIHQLYEDKSKIPFMTQTREERDPRAHGFLRIEKRFRIPREHLADDVIMVTYPFAETIVYSEFRYLIDRLSAISSIRTEYSHIPDRITIDQAISRVLDHSIPDFIVIPIDFYVDLHRWATQLPNPVIQYDGPNAYYLQSNCRLRILWSNKFVRLNSIIIGSLNDSIWNFIRGNDNRRLTVEFEENGDETLLLVQTRFRYDEPQPDQVSIIDFPSELLRQPND